MLRSRLGIALTGGLAAAALLASTAYADTVPIASVGDVQPGNQINVGQSMNVSVGAQLAAGELFQMSYPGNSLPVVVNARIEGLSNTNMNTAGFDVYDGENGGKVVEHVTLGSNNFNHDPQLMEFVYSSGKPQTVTFQFFNWSNLPLTLQVMPVQLPPAALIQVGPTVPDSATAVGISSVAGVQIARG